MTALTPAFIVLALIIGALIGYLTAMREKAPATEAETIPLDWIPSAQRLADIAVKAASQLFDFDDPERNLARLNYCMNFIRDQLKLARWSISDADLNTIRACVEAAWAEFKKK